MIILKVLQTCPLFFFWQRCVREASERKSKRVRGASRNEQIRQT